MVEGGSALQGGVPATRLRSAKHSGHECRVCESKTMAEFLERMAPQIESGR